MFCTNCLSCSFPVNVNITCGFPELVITFVSNTKEGPVKIALNCFLFYLMFVLWRVD